MRNQVLSVLFMLLIAISLQALDPWGDPVVLSGSMTVMAGVNIYGEPASTGDVLAAFVTVGDMEQLRGKADVQILSRNAGCQLQIYTETNGEVVSFKVWDESSQTVLPVLQTISSELSGVVGSWPDNLYQINAGIQQVAVPSFSPPAGIYTMAQDIILSTTTPDAQIYYTLDGSDPSDSSDLYSGPITLSFSATVKARAYKTDWNPSSIAIADFVITGTVATPTIDPPGGVYTTPQNVTLSTSTPDAQIRYTLNGSDPDENSTLYTDPIPVETSITVKVRAFKTDWSPSPIVVADYMITGTVASPDFTPAGGTYTTQQSVAISSTTPDTQIYYTMDGSDPSESSILYASPIDIGVSSVLKARAYKADWTPSAIAAASYVITGTVATPSFAPPQGTYTTPQSVTLSTATADAQIRYTLDGSDPDGSSELYTAPLSVSASATIKAKAYKADWIASSIATAAYVITGTVATPTFAPPAGDYAAAQNVSIFCDTPEAQIRYTTDGTEPDENSQLYSSPLYVDVSTTIKAKAYKQDWAPSETVTAEYVLLLTVADPVIQPPAGTYYEPIQVTITTQTPDASIRYTTDGSTPSETYGTIYGGAINIAETTTIRAIAYKLGMINSQVTSASYVITIVIPEVAAPMFSLPSGTYQAAIDLAITTTTEDADIRYTTDGSDPSATTGILYETPIHIPENTIMQIKAIAYKSGWTSSGIVEANYNVTGTVSEVIFSIPAGVYTTAQNLLLSTATTGASIHFTIDGSEPTQASSLYSAPIVLALDTTQTVKSRAFKADWTPSPITQNTYTITGQVVIPAPIFSVLPGTYSTAQTLFINNPVPAAASVHYTMDGSDPSLSSPVYTSPLTLPLNTTVTVKVAAFLEDWIPSPVYSASYVITGQVLLPAVVFDPPPGVYQTAQAITLYPPLLPADAVLRYTLDGSEPNQNSPVYQSPINLPLNSNTTIRAKGFREDWIPSQTVSATYQITGQVEFIYPIFTPAPGVYTTAQMITINSALPSDAVVRYTTDGSEPTETSQAYATPIFIPLNTEMTIKTKAFKNNWIPSQTFTGFYQITGSISISEPVFTPVPGMYSSPQSVVLNTTTLPAGATLRYTINGGDPNESSQVYTAPIQVGTGETAIIRVRAYLTNWLPSVVYTGVYTVTGQASITAPVFTPPAGTYQTAQFVSINTLTYPAGAIVRYTLDGTDPTVSSQIYTVAIPLALNTATTVKARAFFADWLPSQIYSATYNITGTVATPQFDPPGGTYSTAQSITLSSSTAAATIRYTIDGTEPTDSSPEYSVPIGIPLNTNITIKAKGFKTGWTPSNTATATYNVTGTVATPTFDPPAGTYTSAQSVTISSATPGATIRYTTNGTEPSEASPAYINPITIPLNTNMTIKAKGYLIGWIASQTATAVYTVTGQVVFNTPVFTPAPGVYATAQTITVNSTLPADATIRYTTDGSEPTETSAIYTTAIPLPLETVLTLKVKAFKTGWLPSETHTGAYTTTGSVSIVLPVFTPEPGLYTTAQSVVLNTTTLPAGATLHYTLNGTEPNETSPVYNTPIPVGLNQTVTIRVRAYLANWLPSVIYTGVYTVTGQVSISAPVFMPPAGTYSTAQFVSINTLTYPAGAAVHYTLDGTIPTESSPLYIAAIPITSTSTVLAKAFYTNWLPSQTYSAIYVITGTVATPTFDPPEGNYYTLQYVVISSATGGAAIRYTTDGTEPTETSNLYTTPIIVPLNTTMTIKAKGFHADWIPSNTATATYVITGTVATPSFNPPAGTYTTAQTVTISCATAGATIRYTTNGSEPSEASPAYTNPIAIPLNTTMTIKAKGYRLGWITSPTAQATYQLTGQVAFNTPVFSPAPGVYATAQMITVNSTIPADATIRYTIDGSEPTETSAIYTTAIPLPLETVLTLKVKAFKTDWLPSETYTGAYTTTGSVSIVLPVFTPNPGLYTSPQTIVLNTTTLPAGAILHYTVNGGDPTESSPVYTDPIQVLNGQTATIRVRAFLANWQPSVVYTGVYTVTGQVSINAPVFSLAAGTYATSQTVTVNTITSPPGATVRYTLDGSEPNAASPAYSVPFQLALDTTTTIKVKAFLQDWSPSQTYTATYVITATVAVPTFDPPGGNYTTAQSVFISCTTADATIRYTTDGSEPTGSSAVYSIPIAIPQNTTLTIKAKGFKSNWVPSATATATYNVTGQVILATNPFNPMPGIYTAAQFVTVEPTLQPDNAIMRFTLDGSEPTTNSPAYTTPIPAPANSVTTIKIKGFATNWIPSETATAVYNITGLVARPVFSPLGGTYAVAVNVEISTATEAAVIRYTLDGTDPTQESDVYSAPILIPSFTQNLTIKARAFRADWTPSEIASETYSILPLPIDVVAYSYAGYIRVQWSMGSPARNLQGFNVYRRKLSEANFSKLNNSLIGAQTFFYDDNATELNVHYKYRVTAVYDGVESNPSSVVDIIYQSQDLEIGDATYAYPNPAEGSTTLRLVLNRNENIQLSVSIYDFSGKKLRTLPAITTNEYQTDIAWDLKNTNGVKVGRGTYFARVVANDGVNRSEKVIKIAVK